MAVDYYQLLEVAPDASPEAISASYKRLIFENHPDRNSSPDATAQTVELNNAYRVLSDPDARQRYDSQLRAQQPVPALNVPHVVVGASVLRLYELQTRKPQHRRVRWEEGIWSKISEKFVACKRRCCLVLLQIDPKTNHQIYKHGEDGAVIRIDPNRGEFNLLLPWLESCHQTEDARVATAAR